MSQIFDERRTCLRDRVRSAALRRVIEETVRPGDLVLASGTETGIPRLVASRAEAARIS